MPSHNIPHSAGAVFALLLAFRLVNAYYVQTFFQPDEYFQSLEPAWHWTFGSRSGAWITWEWREQLRSSIHPLIFAAGYRAVDHTTAIVGLDTQLQNTLLRAIPRAIQALCAAVTDLFTWSLANKVYGRNHSASTAALILTIVSPWQWFCSVRTFSNSMETALTVVALDFFPWHSFIQPQDVMARNKARLAGLDPALLCAAVACILRPTNILIWIAIVASLLFRQGLTRNLRALIAHSIVCGGTVLAASASMDRTFYGFWTLPPMKFLYFNVVQSLAEFYGKNRRDYYFTEGLPLLLTTALPFALVGLWQALYPVPHESRGRDHARHAISSTLSVAIVVSVLSLSAISHKEVRFIYPLLPMLHILAANPFAAFYAPFPWSRSRSRALLFFGGIGVSISIAFYVSMVHQRGVIDVMHHLRHRQEAKFFAATLHTSHSQANTVDTSVGFLMPCHSTPWRTYLNYPEVNAWALTCEPPLNMPLQEREFYLDEADVFYADPAAWIAANMQDISDVKKDNLPVSASQDSRRPWPEYLIFFEQLTPSLTWLLDTSRYKECRRFFNTHWHDDWRRQGDVIVWCMRRWEGSHNL